MTSPFNTGPIAPYRNVPVEPQYYQPSVFAINNITNSQAAVVTTFANNNYVVGQLVRFLIPNANGMRQINEQTAYVTSISSPIQFVVDFDTLQFDPFIPIAPLATTIPQVVAVGDINTGIISATGRVVTTTAVPGAFINISPI